MKNYVYEFEDDHYHIFSVGDIVEDESFLFPFIKSDVNTSLVISFIKSLEGIAVTGKTYNLDHADCCYTKKLLAIEVTCGFWIRKGLKEKTGQSPRYEDVTFLISRLTVLNNRKAQYLRGERHV